MDSFDGKWLDQELAGSSFADERLGQRFRKLVDQLEGAMGESLPLACQDWANTKAAYRFFSNERVSEAEILAGHFQSTAGRFTAAEGPILVLQDTTEFTYNRERPDLVGATCRINSGKDKSGRWRMHTVCGLLMHSSLAVTVAGLPLGLAAVKFWTRKKFRGTAALKKKINPTRVPIEQKESFRWLENLRQSTALFGDPDRCVHIGDRESDIYELFCLAQELGTHFLVRSCVDRLAGDGRSKVSDAMDEVAVQGLHQVEVRNSKGKVEQATVEISYRTLRILPPVGKQKRYPALTLTVLHAREPGDPADRPAIDWQLLTDLPVRSHAAAIEKLRWYALRWKIEVFHKILKSGCKAEQARLRTSERLVRGLRDSELACVLDDNDLSLRARGRARNRAHRDGNKAPRPTGARQRLGSAESKDAAPVSQQSREAWRLSRPCQGSATRQHRHVARPLTAHRYQARGRTLPGTYG